MSLNSRWAARPRLITAIVAGFGLSLLSCGREITGPGDGLSFADGFSFAAEFPPSVTEFAEISEGVVDFDRVRVLLTYASGSTALDSVVPFPAGAPSVQPSFRVPLSEDAPAAGETLTLTLSYITASGDTIFRAGPQAVLLVPSRAGDPDPSPVPVVPLYVGVGSAATNVVLSPDTVTVTAGDPFSFTAVATGIDMQPIAGTPIAFRTLDPTIATITAPGTAAGTTLPTRGYARIVARLLTTPADTAIVRVLPRLGSLVAVAGQNQSVPGGTTVSVTVRSLATDGLAIAAAPIAMAVTAGGGSLSAPTAITDAAGDATFTWTLGGAQGAQSVTVSGTGIPNLVINANATFAGATQLVVTQQPPATRMAGTATPTIIVEARTPAGVLYPSFTGTVTLALGTNPTGATLGGTVSTAAVAGVATFSGWQLQRAGVGYTLVASAGGLSAATTTAFDVTPAAASALVLESGGGQVAEPGSALAQPIVARVNDAYGNGVAGQTVNFAVAAGSVTPTSAVTTAAGFASTSWTLGTAGGVQTLTATSTGMTGSPLSVTATAAGAIVTTAVVPQTSTLTAIGATTSLTAQSRDAAENVVPTTYTWTSRTPAVATVNSSGFVTAVGNGTSYVVAIAAGGTRDSALVTVNQVLATIVVAPANRDIYLGAQHAFTAQAVDGLGVALASQPTITWSSQATAVATVSGTGVATGVGLGSTQVRATSGIITGVATLNVRTPITRIAVIRDSTSFVTTDTFTLTALDRTRSYRAVAYDTLDVVMTGIDFAWTSSNPSVALLDSTGTQTARARARANGFTAIRATAQGVTGAAALNVAQVMASIDLRLSAAAIAPTGNSVANPRRLDANGYALPPGGTFTFASADEGVATVNAAGVVTGVAAGATTITATSGTINSNAAGVTVSASVPPVISFGRDTISIGRSATNQAVPIYLSRPHVAPVTVSVGLVANDTIAFFNPTTVTIPQGGTVGTAMLNGRNARTSAVFAVDGGTSGFAGDTAVLVVQASVAFQNGSYTLIANDQLTTQVRLSDPSPAGGTFVTYTYGTPGRVSISPDPAFIPEGQLSANVVIRALAAGGTTVTPAATGVNGTAMTVNTSAASLTASSTTRRIGVGQFDQNLYAYTQYNLFSPLTVTLTPTDSARVQRSPASGVIPAGSYYVYYDVIGVALGTGSIVASAPGFTSATTNVTVTTPRLGICCGGNYNTTSPPFTVTVYAEDSTATTHQRVNALNVQLRSSDPSVIEVINPEVSIGAGQYYHQSTNLRPGGMGGTAWVYAEASGHIADSVLYTVVGPKLEFSFTTARVGAGQYQLNQYVYTPNNVTAPLTVTFTVENPAVLGAPSTVAIPSGLYYAYFDPTGLAPGQSRIIATAPGYRPDTATVTVTTPQIRLSNHEQTTTVNNFAAPLTVTIYSMDSLGSTHYRTAPLPITYTSSDPNVITVSAEDTIQAGIYYSQAARVTIVGPGTATITATAAGHGTSTATYTVIAPQLQFSSTTYRIGRRQFRTPTDFYVYTPNARGVAVPVTITQTRADVDSLTSTALTIPSNLYYAYFGIAGLETGVDTLIASAAGYRPDTMVVTVTTPRLVASGLGNATTTTPPAVVYVYATDSLGTSHYSLDTVYVSQTSSNEAVIAADSTPFFIRPGEYYGQTRVRYVGPGTARMYYGDSLATGYRGPDSTNVVTVTGPSLGFQNSRPILGMRQNGAGTAAYVTIPNAIATPLVVNIVSTDPAVASAPATVTIPQGQTYAYVPIVANDQVGTVQFQASAIGYTGATVNQEVTAPRFVVSAPTSMYSTAPPGTITVYAADANGTAHYTNENVTVTLVSSNGAAATIDSATVVIVAGGYYNQGARVLPGATGTTTITASDARAASYRYNDGTQSVAIVTPPLSMSLGSTHSLGIGQYVDATVNVPHTMASLPVTFSHSSGATSTPASVTITNSTAGTFRLSALSAGTDLVGASASGHSSASSTVTVGLGLIALSTSSSTISTAPTDSALVTVYARSPDNNTRYVTGATTFSLAPSNGNIQLVSGGAVSVPISTVTIPANAQTATFYVKGVAAGTATITLTHANYQTHVTPSLTVTP